VPGAQGRPVDVSIFTVRTDANRDIDPRCAASSPVLNESPVDRISGQIKLSSAYINSFHARRSAEAAGLDDGIMFDREGRLAEASAANVFVIMGDRLVKPPLNPDVFPGITRQTTIDKARAEDIDVAELDLARQPRTDRWYLSHLNSHGNPRCGASR
jgi:branched-chain amino acid aminotransferase